MVTFRAVPSHPERHRSPGAAAVGHAAVRILGQRNAGVIFKAALLAGALATISATITARRRTAIMLSRMFASWRSRGP